MPSKVSSAITKAVKNTGAVGRMTNIGAVSAVEGRTGALAGQAMKLKSSAVSSEA